MIVALALALLAPAAPASAPPQPAAVVDSDAAARAAGNRKADAYRLGLALLAERWPAQVLKIRIDGAAAHAVAGLLLSGVKFHGALDADGFVQEVAALIDRTFAASTVEEVDVWATVPLDVAKGEVVAGDFARPTSRIVFSFTARRTDRDVLQRLRAGDGVFWAADWKAGLTRR